MFRGTAPRLTLMAVVSAVALPLAVATAPPAQAETREISVSDNQFTPAVRRQVNAGDTVTWRLKPGSVNPHSVTLDADGNEDFDDNDDGQWDLNVELSPSATEFSFTFDRAGKFGFFCRHHILSDSMFGSVQVNQAPEPTTTTTTAPPTTTTTTTAPPPPPPPTTATTSPPPPTTATTAPPPPPPTTATTGPPSTAPTTRPWVAPPTTRPPAQASTDPRTDPTGRPTTTTGKATTTGGVRKKASTTTTEAPETTTTTALALPADWIPTPDIVPDGSLTTTSSGPESQVAAGRTRNGKGGSGGGGFPVAGAALLGLAALGGGAWGWYHRSSRYLPA